MECGPRRVYVKHSASDSTALVGSFSSGAMTVERLRNAKTARHRPVDGFRPLSEERVPCTSFEGVATN
jgi:hypothetical protein